MQSLFTTEKYGKCKRCFFYSNQVADTTECLHSYYRHWDKQSKWEHWITKQNPTRISPVVFTSFTRRQQSRVKGYEAADNTPTNRTINIDTMQAGVQPLYDMDILHVTCMTDYQWMRNTPSAAAPPSVPLLQVPNEGRSVRQWQRWCLAFSVSGACRLATVVGTTTRVSIITVV